MRFGNRYADVLCRQKTVGAQPTAFFVGATG
jgi:hypothetical protein